jgi:hypothetical protein
VSTPNLAIAHILQSQAQKEVTANAAFDALDQAVTDRLDVDLAADDVALTSAQFRQHLAFRATGLTEDRDLTVPAIRHLFVVINPSAAHTVHVKRGATTVAVGPETAFLLYADGETDGLHALGGAGGGQGGPYDFGFAKAGTPGAGEVIGKVVLPRALTLPADLADAAGHVDTPPDELFAIDLTVDAVSIGTITISDAGTFTFATADNEPKTVAAGAVVRFVAPDPADPSIAGIAVTLVAALA